MSRMPSLFVSHGAPNLILYDSPTTRFLSEYAKTIEKPKAILSVSAHFETDRPVLVSDSHPEMIYDFGGFEPELYELKYPAPGDPVLAERAAQLLAEAGLGPAIAPKRGYDHGTWVPLMLLYPDADIPVVQLSVQPGLPAAHHYKLGEALTSLRDEGVLIVGSGSFTHNLHEAFLRLRVGDVEAERPDWVESFAMWMVDHIEAGDVEDLLDYREKAPYAVENHPTDEHLMPLYVALGASGDHHKGHRVHDSHQYGVLQLDAFAFN